MSASFDSMTCELMLEAAEKNSQYQEVMNALTDRQLAVFLFNAAHTLELIALKEQAEAALEAKYDELMEDA